MADGAVGGSGGGMLPREVAAFLAGQISFSCGLAVAYPLDTVKVRMQTVAGESAGGMVAVARDVFRSGGATGFYNGLLSPLIGYGIAGAVAFAGYDWAARQVKRWRTGSPDDAGAAAYKLTFGDALLAGMFAGVVNNVPRTVVDRLKTLAQAESISTPAALRRVLATQGPAGLLGGFSVTMAREVPQFSIYFATYGAMVNAIQPAGGGKAPGWQVACVGATAGVLQWLPPMYCIDVVKSRLQGSPPGTYRNMAHCAQVLYAEHGWRVFVRGLGPTIVRGIPLHATTFFVYETVMGVLSDGATH